MAQIPLTRDKFAIVDDKDYAVLSKYKWYAHKLSGYFYAERGTFIGRKSKTYPMHRELLRPAKGQWVDHINGNTLDNRRCNLRIATPQQNNFNKKGRVGSSKYKGVSWAKQLNKWYACIKHNYRTRNLGYYDMEVDAARAYDIAARTLFGEFAKLNLGGQ